MTVAVLTVALALPAAAATSNGKNCNNSWGWSGNSVPAITQSGNCPSAVEQPTAAPVQGEIEDSKLDLSRIFQQIQGQLGNCFSGFFGN